MLLEVAVDTQGHNVQPQNEWGLQQTFKVKIPMYHSILINNCINSATLRIVCHTSNQSKLEDNKAILTNEEDSELCRYSLVQAPPLKRPSVRLLVVYCVRDMEAIDHNLGSWNKTKNQHMESTRIDRKGEKERI